MKLRYFVVVTVAAALTAACANSPTASSPATRTPVQRLTETDSTVARASADGGGYLGSGH